MNIILDNGAFKPEFAHKTDAGADLRSPVEAVVPAHGSVVIDTGVHVEIPEGQTGPPLQKPILPCSGQKVNAATCQAPANHVY